MNVLVIVPAYNEASTLQEVLLAIPQDMDFVVVNDGSSDATEKIAAQNGATVITHSVNRGLGAALRTGFEYAIENKYESVVTLDADGQHEPTEITHVLAALTPGVDVVIGRRAYDVHMPHVRRAYNRLGAVVTSILFGTPLVDTQSGFRAFSLEALRKMSLCTSRMEISSEIIAEAHRLQLKIIEVPISIRYTKYSMSKGQNFFEGIRTAWQLLLRSVS